MDALGPEFGALFVALSYRWLTKKHPDPKGFHLKIVVDVLQRYRGTAGYWNKHGPNPGGSPLVRAFEGKGLGAPDCAIFWDFASLYQKPRAANEDALFLPGLKASNVWYGHAASVCWMQSELPAGFAGVAYEASGWCFVEAAISAGVKPAKQRLDLGKRTEEALEHCYDGDFPNFHIKLTGVCAARRPPALLPSRVRELLQTEKTFTASSDVETVAELYRRFFDGIASSASRLDFRQLQWRADEARQLAAVLPRFTALTALDVSGNKLGAEGGQAIAEGVRISGSLTECNVHGNQLDVQSAKELAKVATEKRVMLFGIKHDQTAADFRDKRLYPPDAILIANDLSVSHSLMQVLAFVSHDSINVPFSLSITLCIL